MDSKVIIDFLTSHIGQEGRYTLATTGVLFPLAGEGRLVDVALRDDGLLQITSEDGMLVLEPERVFALAWDASPAPSPVNTCERRWCWMAIPPKRARWNALRSRANARSASVTPFRRTSTPNPPTKLGRKGKRNG